MKKISMMAGLLAGIANAQATVLMNDSRVMEMSVSNRGLTRLSVRGDVIQDIFVYPFMVGDVATDGSIRLHKSGHVFIAPDGIKQPFYLTVITRKGHVQDLKLSPVVQKAAPLILTLSVPEENPVEVAKAYRKVLENYLLSALQGMVPQGFMPVPVKDVTVRQKDHLKIIPVTVYRSPQYRLSVFDVENTGESDIALMPEFFLSSDDTAIVFEKPALTSQGKTRMAVLTQLHPISFLSPDERPVSVEPLPLTKQTETHRRNKKKKP